MDRRLANETSGGEGDSVEETELVEGTSLWRDAFARLVRNRAAMAGLVVVTLMGLIAVFFEPFSTYVTNFDLDEQHPFVVPKPPMSRSVPLEHYTLSGTSGVHAFETIDANGDDRLKDRELRTHYRRMAFRRLDKDGSGKLDYSEYRAAPLSMDLPGNRVPDCEQWKRIRSSLAPIEKRSIFECTAGEDGRLTFEEAGKVLNTVSPRGASDIRSRLDGDGDGAVSQAEYAGVPLPVVHWFGTDQLGRDVLTRVVYGARISLSVGLLAALVSFFIGTIWGATAGFLGGTVDDVMMRIVDIMYGLPFMILVILLVSVFGQSILLLFIAIGAIRWLTMARIVRGQVISLKEKEYVEAAECIGASKIDILFKHLIPNALGPIIVYTTLMVPAVMLAEAFLSFLGLGVQAPYTSWGLLISQGRQVMKTAPWIIIASGAALAITLLSLNFLGDGLRDALDPQLKEHQ